MQRGFAPSRPVGLLLAIEFTLISSFYLFVFVFVAHGQDARTYLAATRAWLSGGDPWSAGYQGVLFAGPPPTLLALAPFAWMPDEAFVALVVVASTVAAVFALRHLRLPAWWILFPPLTEALTVGNPDVLVLALVLAGAGPLAVLLKTYALIPLALLGRWREVAASVALIALTAPVLPWKQFFGHDVAVTLLTQSDGGKSAWSLPLLVPLAVVALAAIGRDRSWWTVPTLWPATQFHYSVLAIPGTFTALAAAVLALPVTGAPAAALLIEVLIRRRRSGQTDGVPSVSPEDR
jgi:hypothetical protein